MMLLLRQGLILPINKLSLRSTCNWELPDDKIEKSWETEKAENKV